MKPRTAYILVGILAMAVFFVWQRAQVATPDSTSINIHGPTPSVTATSSNSKTPGGTATPITSSGKALLDVPFMVQAPTGNWDALHEEMCEEGTVIMAYAWADGLGLSPSYAEQQIQKLASWETANFGTYTDTSAAQTAQMGQVVYGLHTKLAQNPSVQQIKNEIDAGHVVIMGMAGRMLHNPYYSGAGPLYHMLLIKGYDATGFITNDDGTRNGNSYHYAYDVLIAAAHDWNGDAASLTSNPAVAIVVSK